MSKQPFKRVARKLEVEQEEGRQKDGIRPHLLIVEEIKDSYARFAIPVKPPCDSRLWSATETQMTSKHQVLTFITQRKPCNPDLCPQLSHPEASPAHAKPVLEQKSITRNANQFFKV